MAALDLLELGSYGGWTGSGSNRQETTSIEDTNIIQAADMVSLSDAILQSGDVTHDATGLLPTDFVLQEVCDDGSEDLSPYSYQSSSDSQDSWTIDCAVDDSDVGSNMELPGDKGPTVAGVGSLKEHLRNKIELRRLSEGRGLPQVLFEEPKVYELTWEEKQKQNRRRERNRISANKSRMKRIRRQHSLQQDAAQLEDENQKMRNKIAKLASIKSSYMKLLKSHVCVHNTPARSDGQQDLNLKSDQNSNILHDICRNRPETGTSVSRPIDTEKFRNVPIVTTRRTPFTLGNETRIPSNSGMVHLTESGGLYSDNRALYSAPTTTEAAFRQSSEEGMCSNRNTPTAVRGNEIRVSGHRQRQHSLSASNKKDGEVEGDENRCIAIIKQDLEESTKSLWSF